MGNGRSINLHVAKNINNNWSRKWRLELLVDLTTVSYWSVEEFQRIQAEIDSAAIDQPTVRHNSEDPEISEGPTSDAGEIATSETGESATSDTRDIERTDEGYESDDYIDDHQKRNKRYNTYRRRMIDMLHHVGNRTGCYGILYLRKYRSY
jgi:hypothetical protein